MKKVLFCSDVHFWAYDITLAGLRPYLNFDVLYTSDTPRIHEADLNIYGFKHFFNWLGGQAYAGKKGVSGGATSHNFETKWIKEGKKYIPKFERMVASSKELYDKVSKMNPNTVYIPSGVDADMFVPFDNPGAFTVGWCGQKTTGGFGEVKGNEGRYKWDVKGYELILKPLMDKLDGIVKFSINCADYKNCIPHEDMPSWYDDIDIFICTSLYEGGPLPVLEAASAGKTIISTTVGIVPELIDHGTNGFIVKAPRSREDVSDVIVQFESYIRILTADKQRCAEMGKKMREEILTNWTWKCQAEKWKKYFE